ncbi:MAG TPA: GNAT family N-acetyltransferase [Candidatus Kryptonia bacterium]
MKSMTTKSAKEKILIRRAGKKDAGILADFRYRMFSEMRPDENYSGKKVRFIRKSKSYYLTHVGLKSQFDCVAVSGGEVVGCGSILFLDGPPHISHIGTRLGYILNVYVVSERRREGIATRIMERLHTEGKRHRIRRVSLHASTSGYPLYTGMGYSMNEMYLEKVL